MDTLPQPLLVWQVVPTSGAQRQSSRARGEQQEAGQNLCRRGTHAAALHAEHGDQDLAVGVEGDLTERGHIGRTGRGGVLRI